jgi:DNA-binding PadR family transcriptional regulator
MSAEEELPISSYVVLGLLALLGPRTPYEMKKAVDESIGYFWDFPRAQLYVDPERLARLGLLRAERELEGRRRKTYQLTDAGRERLRHWLSESPPVEVELRDTGLLKLYFGFLLSADDVSAMASREAELHRRRLAEYQGIERALRDEPRGAYGATTLRMGLLYEQLSIQYWEDVAANPPTLPAGVEPGADCDDDKGPD